MKEALVILIILLVIVALTAVRYRKQLAAMLRIYRSVQDVRKQMKQGRQEVPADQEIAAGPLVSCAKCRTWVPEQRAIKLRGGTFFCSSACLESTGTPR